MAKYLVCRILLRHEASRAVVSYQGTRFVLGILANVFWLCNAVHRTSTSYHALTTDTVERFNRILNNMFAHEPCDHTIWDVELAFVTFPYNSSLQYTTGCSKFSLLYGRDTAVPFDRRVPYTRGAKVDNYFATVLTHSYATHLGSHGSTTTNLL